MEKIILLTLGAILNVCEALLRIEINKYRGTLPSREDLRDLTEIANKASNISSEIREFLK